MSLLGVFGNVGLLAGKLINPAAREIPDGPLLVHEACILPNCAQPATQAFDSVRVEDGPLSVCYRHASDVRRWVG